MVVEVMLMRLNRVVGDRSKEKSPARLSCTVDPISYNDANLLRRK